MKRVLVAGATGYLGRYLVSALHARGYWVRALTRPASKDRLAADEVDDLFLGEVTEPDSLAGVCDGIDAVISCLGITRLGRHTYREVDYQGNLNLLARALESAVTRFTYVHVLNAHVLARSPGVAAKQAFVDALEASPIAHQVICPTAFFSDMEAFLDMAVKGRITVFGSGENRVNPVHGHDLAEFCVDFMESTRTRATVGGPEVMTYEEVARKAFASLGRQAKIGHVPGWLMRGLVGVLRWVTPLRVHAPLQFLTGVMTNDMVADCHGRHTLADHFRALAEERHLVSSGPRAQTTVEDR